MDPAIAFVEEHGAPLVFVLGPKTASEYVVKAYEDSTVAKKFP